MLSARLPVGEVSEDHGMSLAPAALAVPTWISPVNAGLNANAKFPLPSRLAKHTTKFRGLALSQHEYVASTPNPCVAAVIETDVCALTVWV
jgi:hypothetical protein